MVTSYAASLYRKFTYKDFLLLDYCDAVIYLFFRLLNILFIEIQFIDNFVGVRISFFKYIFNNVIMFRLKIMFHKYIFKLIRRKFYDSLIFAQGYNMKRVMFLISYFKQKTPILIRDYFKSSSQVIILVQIMSLHIFCFFTCCGFFDDFQQFCFDHYFN